MGCSIHFHTEVKINGTWHHHAEARIQRNYPVFAKMANVRNAGNIIIPLSLPKGIPPDATDLTKFQYKAWEADAHSPSWLNPTEITELHRWIETFGQNEFWKDEFLPSPKQWIDNNFPTFNGYHLHEELLNNEYYKNTGLEDVRYIFWFDN